jgi:hypothetical protein
MWCDGIDMGVQNKVCTGVSGGTTNSDYVPGLVNFGFVSFVLERLDDEVSHFRDVFMGRYLNCPTVELIEVKGHRWSF